MVALRRRSGLCLSVLLLANSMLQWKSSTIAALALPARPKKIAELKAWEWMGLSVEHNLVEWKQASVRKEKIEILQCLSLFNQ